MPISPADLQFAASLSEMSDEEFLLAWQAGVIANDELRIDLIESAATHRFGLSTWRIGPRLGFQIRRAIAFHRGGEALPLRGSDHRCRCLISVGRRRRSDVRWLFRWAGRFAVRRPLQ